VPVAKYRISWMRRLDRKKIILETSSEFRKPTAPLDLHVAARLAVFFRNMTGKRFQADSIFFCRRWAWEIDSCRFVDDQFPETVAGQPFSPNRRREFETRFTAGD